jgi:hypothetical protein
MGVPTSTTFGLTSTRPVGTVGGGSGVKVGGTGVLVGFGVAVGGIGVLVGLDVCVGGMAVLVGSGVEVGIA